MCGFVACLSLRGETPDRAVAEMLPTLTPRGPDDSGTWRQANLAFGFRRLAIIDLTAGGHQPMALEDNSLCVVFNGEIYNYIEVRRELQDLGHAFRSASDTEVLLRAYQEWGADCVKKFVGMWAFLISDTARGIVFGSRDRFGIKPLFLTQSSERILFASEIKAILASTRARSAINWTIASKFLLRGDLDDTTDSFFEGISSIPAAHCFSIDTRTGSRKQWCYWSPESQRESIADAPTRFAELFDDTMRLHSRSDVPIAVHLSGGMDSTSLACGLSELRKRVKSDPIDAICFVDDEFDEAAQIEATIRQTGARLHTLSMPPEEIWARLPKMLRAQDEPVHTMTALVSYCLMELTQQMGVKVVLNGAGADESLAGYSSYFRPFWRELLRDWKLRAVAMQTSAHAAAYGGSTARLISAELKAMVQSRLGSSEVYQATANWKDRLKPDRWFTRDFTSAFHKPVRATLAMSVHDDLHSSISASPLPLYLRLDDRNSMAHSIEARVPFLDHRLVEFAFAVPASELLDGRWNKLLLRRAMSGRIPENVRTRWQKFGFPTPAQRWLRGPLAPAIKETLERLLPQSSDIISGSEVLSDFDRFVAGEVDCESKLFRVLQFLIWRHEVTS